MSTRPRVPIPFGGGVDRATGVMVVEAAAFSDLRHGRLRRGKFELRGGNLVVADDFTSGGALTGITDVVAIHPLRSRGIGVVLTYKLSTGEVFVWTTDNEGSDPTFVGSLGSYGAGLAVPRFICADAYDRVFMAHDEADLTVRFPTMIYNGQTGLLESPLLDDASTAMYFRGVARHGNYIVGWGWGSVADADRPEILRISLPGEPQKFLTPHYFIVGARGEQIVRCTSVAMVLLIRKLSESHVMLGDNRDNFGVKPLDSLYGQVASRLGVTVGGTDYFWSASGPRQSGAGPSDDLAVPLDLDGPAPDTLADTLDVANGIAEYDDITHEVLFIFGRWVYKLSIEDPTVPRWSFDSYPRAVTAAGVLFDNAVSPVGAAPEATVVFDATPIGTKADENLPTNVDITGPFTAEDLLECWRREALGPYAAVWRRVHTELVASRTSVTGVTFPVHRGDYVDMALRITRLGVPGALYVSTNPLDWPAGARRAAESVPISAPAHTGHSQFAGGSPFTAHTLEIDSSVWAATGDYIPSSSYASWQGQIADGVGGWIDLTVISDSAGNSAAPERGIVYFDLTAYVGLTRDIRYRYHTADTDSTYTTIAGVVVV